MATAMTLSRRELLTGLLPFVGLGSSSSAVAAAMSAPRESPSRLWLVREHDGTEITTTFRNSTGYDHGVLLELSWLWRDNEDGRAIWIEPRLFDALAAIQTGIGRANGALLPLVLTSGCRSPAHNGAMEGAARQSTHIDGLAGDVERGVEHQRHAGVPFERFDHRMEERMVCRFHSLNSGAAVRMHHCRNLRA